MATGSVAAPGITIGLEVHVRLATATRLFSRGALPGPDDPPGTRLDPFCVGAPGTLPVLGAAAVDLALRAALALSFTVHRDSRFDRKHYLWPDLPKGYQITQQDRPLATDGVLHLPGPDGPVPHRLQRLHLEEDAGRLHHAPGRTAVDLSRAGAPLIEIVGAPDLHDPATAGAWVRQLRRVLVAAGVSEARMEQGELRVDANLSLRRPDGSHGPRVELKNLGSPGEVEAALRCEAARQQADPSAVRRQTRRWTGEETVALRDKEATVDYRWLPEPDLPPLRISDADLERAREALPAAPLDLHLLAGDRAAQQAWAAAFGDAEVLAGPRGALALAAAAEGDADPARILALAANDLPDDLGRLVPAHLREVAARLLAGMEHRHAAPQLAHAAVHGALPPVPDAAGLDPDELARSIHAVLDAHPDHEARWRAGNRGMEGFFMGRLIPRVPDDQPREALARALGEVLAARRAASPAADGGGGPADGAC